jgi:hypothetical protein
VLQVCDDALSRAAEARRIRTVSSDHQIQIAILELLKYGETFL